MKAGDRTLTMKYELFAADCPRACANFVFLAEAGFFDGAVVFDTQNSRVRFGGYYLTEDASGGVSYAHRSDDTAFLSGLTDEFSEEHYTDSDGETDYSEMLRYTLRSDSTSYDYTAYDFHAVRQRFGQRRERDRIPDLRQKGHAQHQRYDMERGAEQSV